MRFLASSWRNANWSAAAVLPSAICGRQRGGGHLWWCRAGVSVPFLMAICVLATPPADVVGQEDERASFVLGRYEIDRLLEYSPVLRESQVRAVFDPQLLDLWLDALDQGEVDLRRELADSLAIAAERGMPGMDKAIPKLKSLVESDDAHPLIRRSVARALVAIEAEQCAELLHELSRGSDRSLCELIEPALARWDYQPARADWLARVEQRDATNLARTLVAIRCLAEVKDPAAVDPLKQLALDQASLPTMRLAAASAVGRLQPSGFLADSQSLVEGNPAVVDALVAAYLIKSDRSPEAIKVAQSYAQTFAPVAAAVSLEGLYAIDPNHVIALMDFLKTHHDSKLRGLLVQSVLAAPTPTNLQQISSLLNDKIPDVRRAVRKGFEKHAANDELRDAIISSTSEVQNGTDWRGLEQANLLFGALDYEPSAPRAVDLLAHSRPEVMVSAAWALRKMAIDEMLAPIFARAQQNEQGLLGPNGAVVDVQQDQLFQVFGQHRFRPAISMLMKRVPKGSLGPRESAIWALGKIYEDENPRELAAQLAGRLADVNSIPAEEPEIREQSAVALGRMGAAEQTRTLRTFLNADTPNSRVGQACAWSLNRLHGEPIPDVVDEKRPDGGYPLMLIQKRP